MHLYKTLIGQFRPITHRVKYTLIGFNFLQLFDDQERILGQLEVCYWLPNKTNQEKKDLKFADVVLT